MRTTTIALLWIPLLLTGTAMAGVQGSLLEALRNVEGGRAAQDSAEWKAKWPLGYNPAAGTVGLPASPRAPKSAEECTGYQRRSAVIIQDVVTHHSACLSSTSATRQSFSWTDVEREACSNPKCDALHNALHRLGQRADAGYRSCLEAFQRHQPQRARTTSAASTSSSVPSRNSAERPPVSPEDCRIFDDPLRAMALSESDPDRHQALEKRCF